MKSILLLIVCFVFMVGCDNPIKEAKARKINAETSRQNDWHNLALEREKAVTPERVASKQFYIWLTASFLMTMAISTAVGYGVFTIGKAKAEVKKAHIQAHLIPLDPVTRQYPLLTHETKGRLYLINPNTGQLQRLGKAASPCKLLVDGSHKVQQMGVKSERMLIEGEVLD